MTRKNVLLALFTLTAALTVTTPALAGETFSPAWGGPGGSSGFNYRCGVNDFLTGLSGRAGALVDGVQAQCQSSGQRPYYGGFGGVPYTRSCPAGSLVNGIIINAGLYVDGAFLICATIASIQKGVAVETTLSHFGGGGGSASLWRCPPGKAVSGFFGAYGDVVDRIGLVCNDVP